MVVVTITIQDESDHQYLKQAEAVSACSDDPKAMRVTRSAVGAVIANQYGVLSKSANVLPPGLTAPYKKSSTAFSDEDRYNFIEHAERAAIYGALLQGKRLDEATLYCTRVACADCARAIIWFGIKRAVFGSGLSDESRWLRSQEAALRMMQEAGVEVRILTVE